jgi:hypothetical protein
VYAPLLSPGSQKTARLCYSKTEGTQGSSQSLLAKWLLHGQQGKFYQNLFLAVEALLRVGTAAAFIPTGVMRTPALLAGEVCVIFRENFSKGFMFFLQFLV